MKGSPVMASIVPGLVSPLAVEVSHVWADGAELSQNTASHTSEDTGERGSYLLFIFHSSDAGMGHSAGANWPWLPGSCHKN